MVNTRWEAQSHLAGEDNKEVGDSGIFCVLEIKVDQTKVHHHSLEEGCVLDWLALLYLNLETEINVKGYVVETKKQELGFVVFVPG